MEEYLMINEFFANPIVIFVLGTLFALIITGIALWLRSRIQHRTMKPSSVGRRIYGGDVIVNEPVQYLTSSKIARIYDDDEANLIKYTNYLQHQLLDDEYASKQQARDLIRIAKLYRQRAHGNPMTRRTEEIVEDKKNKFQNIPSISFHYANKDQIAGFYNDYFREPTIASLVSEISGEISGEVKGSLPQILESKIGSKDLTKWISTVKLPDTSLNGMFLRYQRETIKSGQVALGLEEVEIELTDLQAFDEALSDLQRRFDFHLEGQLIEKQRSYLKEKAAERTLIKLEQATGWILIEGRFKIEVEGEFYKCSYSHPVNDYLSGQIGPITISIIIPVESIEPHIAGNYKQSIGKLIPMRIYGQIWQPIDRKTSIWDLQLTPLAIY